ncbi:MAG: PAS domain-containing sensor histidine kinase [Acidimicrobiia bacterium]|nr:PAS domain-containing sensor histidine kinase [Acidimicrobiia bacterium]MDX2468442.1 PAS domain-containing sensor histidine kinase [Acidimicrobiia bacterium]
MQQVYHPSSSPESGLFRAFFDHAHIPLLVVDEELCVIEANDAAHDILAIDPGGDGPIHLLSGFWRVSATAVMRMIEAVRREIPVAAVSARTSSDLLVEVDAFVIDEGDVFMMGVVIADRSSVDDAQRRLKDQEERYRSLFEWAPVAMREEDFTAVGAWLDRLRAEGVTDLADHMDSHPQDVERAIMSIRTSRVNAATVELLKAPSVLTVLRGFHSYELTPQVLDAFKQQFMTLWNGGTDHKADYVGVNFVGQPFECRLRWTVPRTTRGRDLSRVAVSLLDLTQLRATERRLERLVADKDRFIASVSHELRTPLSAVFGLSEELSTNWDRFEEAELRELIGLVAAQSADLALLVEDLLAAANLDAGRVSINAEAVDLGSIAAKAISDCRRSNPGLQEIEVSGESKDALTDPARTRQIVRNLITNAIRYGGEEISIEIGGTDSPYVAVVDDGEGVAPEHREAIFVPYFQAGDGDRILGSLGLGLSISRELARRMGGDLSYDYRDGHSIFQLDVPAT